MPRGAGGVPLGDHGPDLLQAQGVRLRLGAARPPQPKLPLRLLRQGAPRPLGQQRRAGPDLDAAREPAPVGGAVPRDADVPSDDAADRLPLVSPVLLEQEGGGREAGEHVDAGLLCLPAQVAHQLAQRKDPALALFVVHLRRGREPPRGSLAEVEEAVLVDGDARGGPGLPVGGRPVLSQQFVQRAQVDGRSRQGVRTDRGALFEDRDGEVQVGGGGALFSERKERSRVEFFFFF